MITTLDSGLKCLVVRRPWSNETVKTILSHDIEAIRIFGAPDWNYWDINYLKDLDGYPLLGIEIVRSEIKDITVFERFPKLKEISLSTKANKVPDFSIFCDLENLCIDWSKKYEALLQHSNINYLNVSGYPNKSFEEISHLSKLFKLHISSHKIESLSGLERLSSLSKLSCFRCINLKNVNALKFSNSLTFVDFESCRKIEEPPLVDFDIRMI